MDLGLKGKVALVAAASQGMGRAVALALGREGCRLAIGARTAGPLAATAKAIRAETQADVLPLGVDVSVAEDVKRLVDRTTAAYGGVDLLVVNAGGPAPGRFESLSEAQWAKAYDLTLMSAVRLIRETVPSMKARGGGSIVALTGTAILQPVTNLILSNSLRAAVAGLVKTLSQELAQDHIRVNSVAPGFIATDRMTEIIRNRAEREGKSFEEAQKSEISQIPWGRLGKPEEVADLVVYLLSERASYLTGNLIQVDGGLYRGVH